MEDGFKFLRKPMEIDCTRTANYRWMKKPVLKTRLLDDMEDESTWKLVGPGEIRFSKERCIAGTQSLRLISKTKMDNGVEPEDSEHYGRPFAEVKCRREFQGEDWSSFNRLSFWVYPTLPGFKVISMYAVLHNDGEIKIPDAYEREGLNFFLLKPDQWNNVVWEIASLPREKITAVDIIYRMQGNEPYATDTVCFDIDKLELQTVEEDHYEGWNVADGKISFSHTGYRAGASKTAIASNLDAGEFLLIDVDKNEIIFTRPVQVRKTNIGTFQIMDFSDVREEGNYVIRAGSAETKPFRIDNDLWRGTIWNIINFFFCERCGFEVPGIHGVCHRDWQCEHNGKKIIINGGWHDAGDLSQSASNTGEATYAMLKLAEKVKNEDNELYERLIEEASWGLDWVLKTRFGDGFRSCWATMDFWTDGIIGDFDDVVAEASNSPFDNFVISATESLAFRTFKDINPDLASFCLKAAIEDWEFGVDAVENQDASSVFTRFYAPVQIYAEEAFASLELYKATGNMKYAQKAFEQARLVMDCQQKQYTNWNVPLSGFFYTSPEKKQILHYEHRSHSQAPLVALSELCREFPNHEEWMQWYSSLVLYSEYINKVTEFTSPYGMFPASIYKLDESDNPDFRKQVENGVKLSAEYYLRLYPVWFVFRGNYSMMLSDAKALASAASVRRNIKLMDMCQRQLEWIVGRNPFVQSTMFGEGYDFAPQYSAMSGDIVGSIPVGMQTSRNKDVPYWPFNNCYNYKEVWVQPPSRWLWIMSDFVSKTRVYGRIKLGNDSKVEFIDNFSKRVYNAIADSASGEYEITLPEGNYKVKYRGMEKDLSLLPGEARRLDLDRMYNVRTVSKTVSGKKINVQLEITGDCSVKLDIRTKNVDIKNKNLILDKVGAAPYLIDIDAEITSKDEGWVILIIPNDNMDDKVEIID